MLPASCILAVTLAAVSFPASSYSPSPSPADLEPSFRLAAVTDAPGPVAEPAASPKANPAPNVRPKSRRPARPSAVPAQEAVPTERDEPAADPAEDEEVKPGQDPASCDGCELAGSLWGLFLMSRRKQIPRPHIRGIPVP